MLEMPCLLPDATVSAYAADGAVLLRGVFNAIELALLERGIEHNLAHLSPLALVASEPDDPGRFVEDFCTWQNNPDYEAFLRNSALPHIATQLMQSVSARRYHDHLVRWPSCPKSTPRPSNFASWPGRWSPAIAWPFTCPDFTLPEALARRSGGACFAPVIWVMMRATHRGYGAPHPRFPVWPNACPLAQCSTIRLSHPSGQWPDIHPTSGALSWPEAACFC